MAGRFVGDEEASDVLLVGNLSVLIKLPTRHSSYSQMTIPISTKFYYFDILFI